jgi:hypothetical protein
MGLFLVVYIFAVPILFYLPIREAHDVMLDFRNKLLNDLSLNYSKVQNSLNLSSEDANKELADTVEKLNQLRGLQEHILRYPVWPFDFRTGIGVAVNSVLPILAALVGLAFDLIS